MLKHILSTLLLLGSSALTYSQVTANPTLPTDADAVVITFDASLASNKSLLNYAGDLYVHTGVLTNLSANNTDWKYVKGSWGNNTTQPKLTRTGANTYTLTISSSIRSYYAVPSAEKITKLCFVFRSSDAAKQTENIYYNVYEQGLTVNISSPSQLKPIYEINSSISVQVNSKNSTSLKLLIDDIEVSNTTETSITQSYTASTYGKHWFKAIASSATETRKDSVYIIVRPEVTTEELPAGLTPGVNIIDNQTATLVLNDPIAKKKYCYAIGDFSNWSVDEQYYMKRTPDGKNYWITISNLDPSKEYIFQFLVDGYLRLADPYTQKTSDPNDQYISSTNYPNLIQYPTGKTTGIASVFSTNPNNYRWSSTSFTPPQKENLVIYELHIRDFVSGDYIQTVKDSLSYLSKLGVNAIELMPISEFEGNDSWGYNPSFYFAPDKAYGAKNDYKEFIDECHKLGIAVIMDIVLNHSFGQSPLVQMYSTSDGTSLGTPTSDNPWYNQTCPHPQYSWGYDFNHESQYTKAFIDSVLKFWLKEYKIDGFRFDFTKGFSNSFPSGLEAYNSSRIAILKRIADKIWSTNSNAYVILEHFCDNAEENELANYGMMLWGNLNYNYNEATMGWLTNSNFSGISYKERGWSTPRLVGYMESHDEERIMYKNKTYGNSSNAAYDVKTLPIGLARTELAVYFFLSIPGPKMIWQFGELGYDFSINENDRVGRKPIHWEYYEDNERRHLFNAYAQFIRLKQNYPVFQTSNYSISLSGANKWIKLIGSDMNAVIMGNFNVQNEISTIDFPNSGKWYEYFLQDSIDLATTTYTHEFTPGEYHLYTTKRIKREDVFVGIASKPLYSNDVSFELWPNPNEGSFQIGLNNATKDVTVSIYSILGQLVISRNYASTNKIEIQLPSGINPGIYFCKIKCGQKTSSYKFIVR